MRFIDLQNESGQSAPSALAASAQAVVAATGQLPNQDPPKAPAPGTWAPPPTPRRAPDKFLFDADFARRVVKFLEPVMRYYFRSELRGVSNLPAQQTILVANHDGGMLPLDGIIIGSGWHHKHGFTRPMHVLVHDMVLRFAPWLRRVGAVLADRQNLDAVMDAGHSVLVYPGASRETFRTFWERKQLTLGSRTGFVKHALRRDVPVTPVVSAGVHETFLVLWRGTWLAERLGFTRLFRADVFPIVAGLPLGIWLGACLPQLPLPAKITVQILPPLDTRKVAEEFLGRPFRLEDLDNDAVVDFCFQRIRDTMQSTLSSLYAERHFPIIG